MNRSLLRHGFVLMLLAMVGGFFIPATAIPRLALSAHTAGLMGGILLLVLGALWPHFDLGPRQRAVAKWSWLYSGYANWAGCLLGAIAGAGRTTPVASAGATGSAAAEGAVAFLLFSVGFVSLTAASLSLWGLRGGVAGKAPEPARP